MNFFLLLVYLFLFVAGVSARTLKPLSDDPEQKGIELFNEGKYKQALPFFEDLVRLYPEDQKLNYYLGASLIETKEYSPEATKVLKKAEGGGVPEKVWWYLAIANHSQGDFVTALDYYRHFEENTRSKDRKELDFDRIVNLCEQGINPFLLKVNEARGGEQHEAVVDTIVPQVEHGDTLTILEKPEPKFEIPSSLYDYIIAFQVNPELKYLKLSQFKERKAQVNYAKALLKNDALDSVTAYTDLLRKQYATSDDDQKKKLAEQIITNEQQVINLDRQIAQLNMEAHQQEAVYWENASSMQRDFILNQNKAIVDSINEIEQRTQERINELPPEEVIVPLPEKEESEFGESVEAGVIYKIQIGAYSKGLPEWVERLYKKLSFIRKIDSYQDDSGITVYTTGELHSYADAVALQRQVKVEGVLKPIIAAYKNGTRIKVSEARKLTGEL